MRIFSSKNTNKTEVTNKIVSSLYSFVNENKQGFTALQENPVEFKKANYFPIRKYSVVLFLFFAVISIDLSAQNAVVSEKYGKTLNLGLGIGGYAGYYRYVGHSLPVFHINYEIGAAKNFTLAPFVSFSTYQNRYYWGDNAHNYPYKYYYFRETVIPVGVKGTYYFDQLLQANSRWDFYLAGSLGYAFVNSSWDSDYYGDKNYYHNPGALFLDIHIGTEFHATSRIGLFLDLSSGVSTIGLAIH